MPVEADEFGAAQGGRPPQRQERAFQSRRAIPCLAPAHILLGLSALAIVTSGIRGCQIGYRDQRTCSVGMLIVQSTPLGEN